MTIESEKNQDNVKNSIAQYLPTEPMITQSDSLEEIAETLQEEEEKKDDVISMNSMFSEYQTTTFDYLPMS